MLRALIILLLLTPKAFGAAASWIPVGTDLKPVFTGSIIIPSIALSGGVCTVSATGKFGSVVAASGNGSSTIVQRDGSGNITVNHMTAGGCYDTSNRLRVDLDSHLLYDNATIQSEDFGNRQLFDGNGATVGAWDSVNGISGYIGFNLHTTGAQPTCDSTHRGLMWDIQGAAGVADIIQICQKNALDVYIWTTH